MTVTECADGKVVVGSRPDYEKYSGDNQTTRNNKLIVNLVRDQELVDVVIFGFVAMDGSWMERLSSPTGDRAPLNQSYHALNVYPLSEEYQRILAFLHYAFAPLNQQCLMYTRGNAWQVATMWGPTDRYPGMSTLVASFHRCVVDC